jgi:hypothetical protein
VTVAVTVGGGGAIVGSGCALADVVAGGGGSG